jgi:hypothetical protein
MEVGKRCQFLRSGRRRSQHRGLEGPGHPPARAALVVFAFAVVALSDIPPAVGIAGTHSSAHRRSAREQRDRGGIEPIGQGRSGHPGVELIRAGTEQRPHERLEPPAGRLHLFVTHGDATLGELLGAQATVFQEPRRVEHLGDGAEEVTDLAIAGQKERRSVTAPSTPSHSFAGSDPVGQRQDGPKTYYPGTVRVRWLQHAGGWAGG